MGSQRELPIHNIPQASSNQLIAVTALKEIQSLGEISSKLLRSQYVDSTNNGFLDQSSQPPSSLATKAENLEKALKFLKDQKKTKYASEFLVEYFSDFRFFKQVSQHLNETQLSQIVLELKLETFKKQSIIFQQNDVGKNMYFVLQGKVAILIPNSHKQQQSLNSPSSKRSNSNINDSPRGGSGGNTIGMTDPGTPDNQNTRNLSNNDVNNTNSKSNVMTDNKVNSFNSGKNSSNSITNKKTNEIENLQKSNSIQLINPAPSASVQSSENISQPNHDNNNPYLKKESSRDTSSPSSQIDALRNRSPTEQIFQFPSVTPQLHPIHPSLFSSNSNTITSPISQSIVPVKSVEQLFQDYLMKQLSLTPSESSISIEEEFEYFRRFRLNNTKLVNTVAQGNSFGEVALEQRIPRTATAVTITDCQLATLSYESFRKLLSRIYEKIQDEQRSFLKAIPPFDNWPNFGIMLIFNNCEELEYSISNFIYKEDDPSSYVYFIKEGEVEVTKRFKIDKCDTVTLQKKNVLLKRVVMQKLVRGRMFGEFEAIQLFIEQPKKPPTIQQLLSKSISSHKINSFAPCRTTEAICKTRVKVMRINLELLVANYWAINNPQDHAFFTMHLKAMTDRIAKIQANIDEYQTINQQNQEVCQLSEMLLQSNQNNSTGNFQRSQSRQSSIFIEQIPHLDNHENNMKQQGILPLSIDSSLQNHQDSINKTKDPHIKQQQQQHPQLQQSSSGNSSPIQGQIKSQKSLGYIALHHNNTTNLPEQQLPQSISPQPLGSFISGLGSRSISPTIGTSIPATPLPASKLHAIQQQPLPSSFYKLKNVSSAGLDSGLGISYPLSSARSSDLIYSPPQSLRSIGYNNPQVSKKDMIIINSNQYINLLQMANEDKTNTTGNKADTAIISGNLGNEGVLREGNKQPDRITTTISTQTKYFQDYSPDNPYEPRKSDALSEELFQGYACTPSPLPINQHYKFESPQHDKRSSDMDAKHRRTSSNKNRMNDSRLSDQSSFVSPFRRSSEWPKEIQEEDEEDLGRANQFKFKKFQLEDNPLIQSRAKSLLEKQKKQQQERRINSQDLGQGREQKRNPLKLSFSRHEDFKIQGRLNGSSNKDTNIKKLQQPSMQTGQGQDQDQETLKNQELLKKQSQKQARKRALMKRLQLPQSDEFDKLLVKSYMLTPNMDNNYKTDKKDVELPLSQFPCNTNIQQPQIPFRNTSLKLFLQSQQSSPSNQRMSSRMYCQTAQSSARSTKSCYYKFQLHTDPAQSPIPLSDNPSSTLMSLNEPLKGNSLHILVNSSIRQAKSQQTTRNHSNEHVLNNQPGQRSLLQQDAQKDQKTKKIIVMLNSQTKNTTNMLRRRRTTSQLSLLSSKSQQTLLSPSPSSCCVPLEQFFFPAAKNSKLLLRNNQSSYNLVSPAPSTALPISTVNDSLTTPAKPESLGQVNNISNRSASRASLHDNSSSSLPNKSGLFYSCLLASAKRSSEAKQKRTSIDSLQNAAKLPPTMRKSLLQDEEQNNSKVSQFNRIQIKSPVNPRVNKSYNLNGKHPQLSIGIACLTQRQGKNEDLGYKLNNKSNRSNNISNSNNITARQSIHLANSQKESLQVRNSNLLSQPALFKNFSKLSAHKLCPSAEITVKK